MATRLVTIARHRYLPHTAIVSNMTQLEARVRAAIASERLVRDSARLVVSADEIGAVTLRGTVSSPLQSRAAAHAARTVDGVLDVINEIKVKPLRRARTAPDAAPARGATVKSRAAARRATPGG